MLPRAGLEDVNLRKGTHRMWSTSWKKQPGIGPSAEVAAWIQATANTIRILFCCYGTQLTWLVRHGVKTNSRSLLNSPAQSQLPWITAAPTGPMRNVHQGGFGFLCWKDLTYWCNREMLLFNQWLVVSAILNKALLVLQHCLFRYSLLGYFTLLWGLTPVPSPLCWVLGAFRMILTLPASHKLQLY